MPDAATCKTFSQDPANKTCIACALTQDTAVSYGPIVAGHVTFNLNVSGCVALLEPCNQECAVALQDISDCEALACESNCPVPTNDNGTAFQAFSRCETNAGGCACKSYGDKATCFDAIVTRSSAAAVCQSSGTTFSENAKPMVRLFCGT